MSYIVPRDKPKRCTRPKCRFMDRDTLDCRLQDKSWESFEEQYEHCPLIEVPTPHGRLIDADKFKADRSMKNDCAECEKELQGSSRSCEYDRIYSKMDFCEWIDNAETVIEAEEMK